jgi:hypothetical protein
MQDFFIRHASVGLHYPSSDNQVSAPPSHAPTLSALGAPEQMRRLADLPLWSALIERFHPARQQIKGTEVWQTCFGRAI